MGIFTGLYKLWASTSVITHYNSLTTPSNDDIPNTIPKGVQCDKVKKCDAKGKICAFICKPSSVVTSPSTQSYLKLQRQLSYTQPFCRAQIIGTHNSAITLADGYGIEDHVFEKMLHRIPGTSHSQIHTNDQYFSLTDQLQMGVRLIELDVHWFNNNLRIAHCGGYHGKLLDTLISAINSIAKKLGYNIQWDSETIGCSPSLSSIPASETRVLDSALSELATWIKSSRNEFLWVFLDDQADLRKWGKVPKLLSSIENAFPAEMILRPSDISTSSFPPITSWIKAGKQVMFLTGTDYGKDVNGDLLFVKDDICDWTEPDLPLAPFPRCGFRKHRRNINDDFNVIFRPFSSEIQYGPLNAEGHPGPNMFLLDTKSLSQVVECNANIPSPDNITPERMEATVWSFDTTTDDDNATPYNASHCVVMAETMRTNTPRFKWRNEVDCHKKYAAGCQSLFDQNYWVIGNLVSMMDDHNIENSSACPAGFRFVPPVNGYQNRMLQEALRHHGVREANDGVWINLKGYLGVNVYENPISNLE